MPLNVVNDPILLFIEYTNKVCPTDDDVKIIIVDSTEPIMDANGEECLGRYVRSYTKEVPHLILVQDGLECDEILYVLAHEYSHHRTWCEDQALLSDEASHPQCFMDLCENLYNDVINYIYNKIEGIQ